MWTTLLVFNLILSRWLLREEITPPKALGSVVILVGAVLCVLGTPLSGGCDGVETEFTADEWTELWAAPAASIWFTLLLACVLADLWREDAGALFDAGPSPATHAILTSLKAGATVSQLALAPKTVLQTL